MPSSVLPESGANPITSQLIKVQKLCILILIVSFSCMTDFEGDFLSGYFASIGDIGFLRRSNRLIREFIADLRSHIDFRPGDDDDDRDDDDFLSRARDRDRDNTNRFDVRRFLGNVVLDIEDAAVEEFAGQLNESDPLVQCIRQVIEVTELLW